MKKLCKQSVCMLMASGTLFAGCATAQETETQPPTPPTPPKAPKAFVVQAPNAPAPPGKRSITIKSLEAAEEEGKERTWLGVGLGELDEALESQLKLKDGSGLLVTYVAKDSPAEKAGLQKNDVLVEMEGQTLMVPAQLQKLVQSRKEGEKVTLKFLRGGKKDSVEATLGKTKTRVLTSDGDNNLMWHATPGANAFTFNPGIHGEHAAILKKALEEAKIDQKRVELEVKRSMEEARKAMEEALRATRQKGSLKEVEKELELLSKSPLFVPNDATVIVRSTDSSTKCMVQADESGTVVLVKNPKLRLTAHDKDGSLIFDGEVETKEQREKIPAVLSKKVAPMLEKFSSGDDE